MERMLKSKVITTLALSVAAVLMAAVSADGSTYTWIGPSGGNWNDASNWSTDSTTYSFPSIFEAGNTAVIGTGGTVIIDKAGSVVAGEYGDTGVSYIQLSNGSVLELDGTRDVHGESTLGTVTSGAGGGTILLNGAWFSLYSTDENINLIVSGTESVLRAGHGGTPTIYGDLSGTGRLCTLSGRGTLYLAGSVTPGAVGEVGTLEISYKYDVGHTSACAKDFGADIVFNFDLGSTYNYDKLLISQNGNTMTIHDLDLDNFNFNYLDGFGEGTYVLIDDFSSTDVITGSLGTNLTRIVGDYQETLSLMDNDFILTVSYVPEPATMMLLLAGSVLSLKKRRR